MMRYWITGCALFAVLATSASAGAHPSFPGKLQERLDMPCVPQCTLCHVDTNGGLGTVVTPFGGRMLTAIRQARQQALPKELDLKDSIEPAIAGFFSPTANSDNDDMPDLEELREGRNPNQPGAGNLCAIYGCNSARAVRSGGVDPWALGAAAVALVGIARRRKNPKPKVTV
jgi:hypothetical protein